MNLIALGDKRIRDANWLMQRKEADTIGLYYN